jgi:predicted  nucleic acid-binding Zn ribbon protein
LKHIGVLTLYRILLIRARTHTHTHTRTYIYMYIYRVSGESNGNLPLRTCPGCSVPEPYRSPDWVLVAAKPA